MKGRVRLSGEPTYVRASSPRRVGPFAKAFPGRIDDRLRIPGHVVERVNVSRTRDVLTTPTMYPGIHRRATTNPGTCSRSRQCIPDSGRIVARQCVPGYIDASFGTRRRRDRKVTEQAY